MLRAPLSAYGLLALPGHMSALVTTGATDVATRVAIVAWAAAMPLLAVLSLAIELQRTRRYASYPWYFVVAQAIAQGGALIGFGAALWHVWWVASVVLLLGSVAGLLFYQLYCRRLVKDNELERARRQR